MVMVINILLAAGWISVMLSFIRAQMLGEQAVMIIGCIISATLLTFYVFIGSGNVEGIGIGF